MAEQSTTYTLRGRIMDTSDNWLPDVRVALRHADVVAHTDGNGLFELSFEADEPLTPDGNGAYEYLELDEEAHLGRSIAITDLEYFDEPIVEKMEPNPVGEDNVGFSVRMRAAHSIHGLPRSVPGLGDDEPITAAHLRQGLQHVAARRGERTERAWFYAHVPAQSERLKAAFLISLHGMGNIDHPVLRRFADEHDIALVGVEGVPVQRGCWPVSALDEQLRRLGEMTGHPELVDVPVLTFGHSNGTGFATVYAAERPERLIGWISYHSGHAWQLLLPGVEEAPGLVMHGHLDQWLENGQEEAVKNLRRQREAPVAMMLEAHVGHGPVDRDATWAFIVEFCKAAMRVRLNDDGTLRPIEIEQGWLGELYNRGIGGQQDLNIAPWLDFAGDRSTANWLSDRAFAETWQTYGRTDPRQ